MASPQDAGRRRGFRTALLLSGFLLSSLAVAEVPASTPAAAAEGVTLITTSSTTTTAWTDQNPRHPDDAANAVDPIANQKLQDLRLRVSQTSDLLSQTVEVSWEGLGTTDKQAFMQVMQCWSDGPAVPPTREQCAFGGIDDTGAEGTGFGRTRQLSVDPRETTYLNNGDLDPVAVDGAIPGTSWAQEASLVLGTNQQQCPPTAVGYFLSMVPPRDVLTSGALPASIVLADSPSSRPASLTRQENGSERTYATVTPAFRLSDVAAANGLQRLPLGQYRFQLGCKAEGGAEVARFVGYLEQADSDNGQIWRRSFHPGGVSVPFDPLGDTPDTAATSPYERQEVLEYLKPRSTNEVWQALRRADGGGSVVMEMLTDLDAQHLGCGRVDTERVRSCWVVAVPRFGVEPNGLPQETAGLYSPMSQTLWDRRIAVPLTFAPVASGCQIGSGLKQLLAHDSALNALRSWQPTFCGDANTASSILGPLQDDSIRAGISEPNRMGIVTVPDEGAPTVVKAPVATSGVVVGFAVDRQIRFGSDLSALNGTRATVMNLNARLVAKILTQSYDSGAAPNGGKTSGVNSPDRSGSFTPTFSPARNFPADNPRTLYDDPEFLKLNPDFATWLKESVGLNGLDMADVLVSANDTDAYQTLWKWILGDPAARAFLDGAADPDGMLVNPYYKGQITDATSSFPLLDPTCMDDIEDPTADNFPLLCQINNHPRVDDDAEAAQAAIRGDTKRNNVAPLLFAGIGGFLAENRQQQGRLGMMVITTSAAAERYGLPTARLQNADGDFVPSTAEAMAKARDQMLIREDGVLVPEPASVRRGGYPLTTNSYAMVDVAATTQAQNNAFAAILDYAAGPGQRSGTAVGELPGGYAPLSTALVAQTRAAATLLRDPSSLLPKQVAESVEAVAPAEGPLDLPPETDLAAEPDVGSGVGTDPDTTSEDTTSEDDSALEVAGGLDGVVPDTNGPLAAAGEQPKVVKPVGVTSSPFASLRWTIPVLLIIGMMAAVASRLLANFGRASS